MNPAIAPLTAPVPDEARGVRVCRRIARHHAKTFYFASHCLPRATRAHAYAIYGFCRWADNGVDDAPGPAEARAGLARARDVLDLAYSRAPVPPGLLAFRKAVRECAIPKTLFDALLDGMAMDLTIARYPDFDALRLYCYRAAGVVGRMMSHVFGYRDRRCLPHAEALGIAMQLTNILRDVAEDLDRGRVYLPQDELARFDVTEDQLSRRLVDDRFRALMRFQIDRARSFYAASDPGIPWLIGDASRLTVRVMGRLYAGILSSIERLDCDVFSARARVPFPRKLRTLAACQAETWLESLRRSWT